MRYILNDDFTQIAETTGTVVNIGNVAVELSNNTDTRTGILLYPRKRFSFDNATLYARQASGYRGVATIAVIPVVDYHGGGNGSGGGDNVDFATDTEVQEMINNVTHKDTSGTTPSVTPSDDGFATDTEVQDMINKVLGN